MLIKDWTFLKVQNSEMWHVSLYLSTKLNRNTIYLFYIYIYILALKSPLNSTYMFAIQNGLFRDIGQIFHLSLQKLRKQFVEMCMFSTHKYLNVCFSFKFSNFIANPQEEEFIHGFGII